MLKKHGTVRLGRKKSQQKRKFMPTKAGCCGTGRKEGDDESGEKDLKCEKQLLGTVTPGTQNTNIMLQKC